MKKFWKPPFPVNEKAKKLILTMKLTVFILFLTLMQVSATIYSQTKFSFRVENKQVVEVLRQIEESSNFRFFFLREQVDVERRVNVTARNATVEQILEELFRGQPVSYEFANEALILLTHDDNTVGSVSDYLKEGMQQPEVSGRVIDSSGQPLPGVTILVKGTTQGTVTNMDGDYLLKNIPEDAILVFSFVGMQTQEVEVADQTHIYLTMVLNAIGIEEVVAIGYGTMRKADVTGSVAQVKTENLEAVPVYNIEQALKSQAPGVTVRQNSGVPGGRIEVTVRGGNSMIGDNQPLYVVDGFPITGDISFLNPSDIESVDILKDASSTAIYGARGANGVIIVTSKRGKIGQKSLIEINSMTGVAVESNRYEMLDAKQYAEVANEWLKNSGKQPYFNLTDVRNPGTDWQDFIFRKAMLNNHKISFSGSLSKTNFSLSSNFYDQEGIVNHTDYKKGTFSLNLDHEFNNVISMAVNLNFGRSERNHLPVDNNGPLIYGTMNAAPTLSPYDENGNIIRIGQAYAWTEPSDSNPAIFNPPYKHRDLKNFIIGNSSFNISFTNALSLKSLFGLEYNNNFGDNYTPIIFPEDRGSGSQSSSFHNSILLENILSYVKTWSAKHKLNMIGGNTYQSFVRRNFGIGVSGFSNNTTENYNLGAAETIGNPSSGYSKWILASWLGRANYSFDDKYMFTASIRADGSSRFGANNKWGIFPSGAIAWRVSKESFMENIHLINSFKVRASYGITGNTALSPYQSLDRLTSVKYIFDGNTEIIGFVPDGIANNDLKWESTAQLNIGFDLTIINNRLRFTYDYYKKNTSNLLASVPLPPSIGFGTSLQNIGEIQNSGFEISFAADILRNEFKWDIYSHFSTNNNKVVELAGNKDIYAGFINIFRNISLARVGEPLGVFYGLTEDGLNEQGYYKYIERNNDGAITDLDKTIIGNPYPDFIFGFNSNFSWKKFELNFFLEGVYGNDLLWATGGAYLNSFQRGQNQLADLYGNYWTAENPDPNAKYPKVSPQTQALISDRFIKDGSYLRLKSMRFAYNLPAKNVEWLNGAQIYLSGTNLFTFTNYPGVDPDVNTYGTDEQDISTRLAQGVDATAYPSSKIYSVGVKLSF